METVIKILKVITSWILGTMTGISAIPFVMSQDCEVRLMVAYTEAAADGFGGTLNNNWNNLEMNKEIKKTVNNINISFKNSEIHHRVKLASIERVQRTSNSCPSTHLDYLINDNDKHWDRLHALRDKYKADVVALIVNDPSRCGLSGKALNANDAFIIIHYECLLENYSLARQLGYLYGAGNHEKQSERFNPNSDPRAYGFWYEDEEDEDYHFSTIMGYTDEVLSYRPNDPSYNDFDLIPYWSNPGRTYNGKKTNYTTVLTGDENHNNAAVINQNAQIVANHLSTIISDYIPFDIVGSNEYVNPVAYENLTLGDEDEVIPMIVEEGGELEATTEGSIKVKKARFKEGSRVTLSISDAPICLSHDLPSEASQTVAPPIIREEETIAANSEMVTVKHVIAYPNPFTHAATIRYHVNGENQPVEITVFYSTGERVVTLLQHESHKIGVHEVVFDGSGFPNGIYFYRVRIGNEITTGKLLLQK